MKQSRYRVGCLAFLAFVQFSLSSCESDGKVSGTVEDVHGVGIEGAEVQLGGQSQTTNSDGEYEIAPVAHSINHTVTASKEGYLSDSHSAFILDGETETVNFTLKPKDDEEENRPFAGCSGASSNHLASIGVKSNTYGNGQLDQLMSMIAADVRAFFSHIPASVYALHEPSPQQANAWSTPQGEILFGGYMVNRIWPYGEFALAGVMAHEWAHQIQFRNGWIGNGRLTKFSELEADAYAGFYMAFNGFQGQGDWNQHQGFFWSIYSLGDTYFNSPSHHGTPEQRMNAAYLGYMTAVDAVSNGYTLYDNDLHYIFSSTIGGVPSEKTLSPLSNPDARKLTETLRSMNLDHKRPAAKSMKDVSKEQRERFVNTLYRK